MANDLQKINAQTIRSYNELYNAIIADMQKQKPKTYNAVKKVFVDNEYIDASEAIVLDANYKATIIGLGESYAIVSLDDFNQYFLDTKFDGLTLSQRIHDSQTQAIRETTKVIKQELKFRTNWKTLSKKISKTSNSVGDVNKQILNLAEEGNKYLKGKLSKTEIKAFNAKIKKAQKYVSGLSEGNAPTKQLKKAYQDIIGVVDGTSNKTLNTVIDNAIKKKIAYNNERIARTELSRANSMAFHRRINDDDDIVGFIWKLSPDHPRPDECDMYAEINNGMGAGVYRKDDSVTIPAHPHCLCTLQPYVIKNNRKNKLKPMSKKTASAYLDKIPDKKRGQIIGVANAKYKTKYISGLEKRGVTFGGSKPKPLPKRLVELKERE